MYILQQYVHTSHKLEYDTNTVYYYLLKALNVITWNNQQIYTSPSKTRQDLVYMYWIFYIFGSMVCPLDLLQAWKNYSSCC